MPSLTITQGRVIDPANDIDEITDLVIDNGQILKLGKTSTPQTDQVLNASG